MEQFPPFNPANTAAAPSEPRRAVKVMIFSEIRFLRESLADILARDVGIAIIGHHATLSDVLVRRATNQANVFLLDAAFSGGVGAAACIREAVPDGRVVVFAVGETEENIVAWAEAGVAGYVPRTAALHDLARLLHDIINGKQACSEEVAAGLLRRIAAGSHRERPAGNVDAPLTERELQVLDLIQDGLSNKEIARRLTISLGTTKSHVHNLLAKLNLQRRAQAAAWMRQHADRSAVVRMRERAMAVQPREL
jgi:two-component system, NarL family, nitrate/nitrite response regulator NarL